LEGHYGEQSGSGTATLADDVLDGESKASAVHSLESHVVASGSRQLEVHHGEQSGTAAALADDGLAGELKARAVHSLESHVVASGSGQLREHYGEHSGDGADDVQYTKERASLQSQLAQPSPPRCVTGYAKIPPPGGGVHEVRGQEGPGDLGGDGALASELAEDKVDGRGGMRCTDALAGDVLAWESKACAVHSREGVTS
jgi:hypothetical protein